MTLRQHLPEGRFRKGIKLPYEAKELICIVPNFACASKTDC